MNPKFGDPIFLSGGSILKRVRKILQQPEAADIAVAFWGNDAIKMLGLNDRHGTDQRRSTRIICDLMSGACNPHEIKRLQKLSHIGLEIRALDGLHAKVYIAGNKFVVGSANASTNGLGIEDTEPDRHEAGIFLENPILASEIWEWFEQLWITKSREIDDPMLNAAKDRWLKRRNQLREIFSPDPPKDGSGERDPAVLDSQDNHGEWFDNDKITSRMDIKNEIFIGIAASHSKRHFCMTAIGVISIETSPRVRLGRIDDTSPKKFSSVVLYCSYAT